tara:strand:- start:6948 stop:7634 length:687 start_codon:yes stop_codon:yes gene_type:complete
MAKKIKLDFGEEDNVISWILVNSLGKLRFSRTSYYYLIIVPIIVKALDKLNNPMLLKFGESNIQINLELPFSWYLFYFGALSISIASLLYQIFCPELIKDFRNYGEFLDAGESDSYLARVSRKYNITPFAWGSLGTPYIVEKKTETVKNTATSRRFEAPLKTLETITDYKHNIKYQEERKDAFNNIYNEVKFRNKKIMNTSFCFYILGFAAFTWVILQNIAFVIKHIL